MQQMNFPPAYPHDPIEQIGDEVFMARGSIKLNPLLRISRNMAIVRSHGELALINAIRLNDQELERLDGLGVVKHLFRLGAFHGRDDPFYMARYRPLFWCQAGGTAYPQPPIDQVLTENVTLPFDGASLFCFRNTKQPESALRVAGDVLLTCDAVQHYGDYTHNNRLARLLMPFIGFRKTTVIGPVWLKLMTPEGGSLHGEFERLLEWDFDRLLGAHGTFLASGAHAAVRQAMARAFSA